MMYRSPYGAKHRRPNRMYALVKRRARSSSHRLALRVVDQANPEGRGPWVHPGCEVEHRVKGRAVDCARRMIWRLAEQPEFLRERVKMGRFLEVRGWLESS